MWTYDRTLEYPVNISKPNAKLAKVIISQFGGPDGELGASQRYLSQRYSNGDKRVCGILTDIGVSVVKLRTTHAACSFLFLCQSHHIVETHPV